MQGHEFRDEWRHCTHSIFSWVCKCRSLHRNLYEQSTNAYKSTNSVWIGTVYFKWKWAEMSQCLYWVRNVFRELCNTLCTQYRYDGTKRVCLEESMAITLVVLGSGMCNRMVHERFQHSGETVHRHVDTIVTLLANATVANIIKLADPTFPNVPQHICNSERYWPHFKVLCEFGILTWFYSIYLYCYIPYQISHGIYVAMVRIAFVRLMGFTSP